MVKERTESGWCSKNSEEIAEDKKRFDRLMLIPMIELPDEDVEWAYKQDLFNSNNSKAIWKAELQRRGILV